MTEERDELTGLAGRPALRTELEELIAREQEAALGLLDVDRLHEINQDLGRAAGDRVLAALGRILQTVPDGTAYRYSGDEFAVVLPGFTLESAFLSMEALRRQVEGAAGGFGLPEGRPLTISIGVTQWPRDAGDVDRLLKQADAALYNAKEGGRNRVGLPANEEMVMKSCYYPSGALKRLKHVAERLGRTESRLLREALVDLLRKYDQRP